MQDPNDELPIWNKVDESFKFIELLLRLNSNLKKNKRKKDIML